MAYENNTTGTSTYSSPDTGGYSNVSKLKNLGEVYILPTGHIWSGKVHQLEDGSYATGEFPNNPASVAVVKVPLVPEFPNEGLLGQGEVFQQVFKSITTWSNASEGSLVNLNSRIVELGETIESNFSLITLALNKILNFIEQNNIQTESAGTGQILDYEINYQLDAATTKDHNGKIQSIEYEHSNSDPYYVFNGNSSTGLTNNGWFDIRDKAIIIDMVSRTGAPVELSQVEALLLDKNYVPGFDGILKVKLNGNPSISHLDLVSNGEITGVSMDQGETWLAEWNSFPSLAVSEVWFEIKRTAPVPFTSYVTTDLTADLLGDPQPDQYEISPAAYQRTELNIGKLKVSSISYGTEKVFESGPYYIQAGTLRSITLDAVEVLEGSTDNDSYFEYKIVIAGKEYGITPWSRQGTNPRIYYINSALSNDTKQLLGSEGVGFIDTGSSEVSFSVKTKLIRPDDSHITPKVKGLAFNYGTSLNGGIDG